jgi:5-methylcytosine-specific restriction protein B
LNGKEAEKCLDQMAAGGKFVRVSAGDRSKAIIYQAESGRIFALIPESATAKLVFERKPRGVELQWDSLIGRVGAELVDQQLKTTGLQGNDAAQLVAGKQQVVVVPTEGQLRDIVEWYVSGSQDLRKALSRISVEAAMDAYDEYVVTGAHGEVFKRFGEPRDYWVRSTRARSNRV